MIPKAIGRVLLMVFVPAAVLLPGCDNEDELGYAPANCSRDRPFTGFLRVQVTLNQTNRRIPLTIFEGEYEEGAVVREDTVSVVLSNYELPVDKNYAVLARYVSGVDTVLVLDSERLEVNSDEYKDATCYYVRRAEADVRLHE